ncbi:MAG TPA: hypothetical protein VHZ53_02380 [Steroidobacteraceae bacterium]|nr:hypothetical protein [Steroidobacteraceae bacterium]
MKTAVITGGGSGIGRAVALRLIDAGYRVANAGSLTGNAPFESITLDAWRTVVDTNLTGSFLCARAARSTSAMQEATRRPCASASSRPTARAATSR